MCIMGPGKKKLSEAWKSPRNLFLKQGTNPVQGNQRVVVVLRSVTSSLRASSLLGSHARLIWGASGERGERCSRPKLISRETAVESLLSG